MIDQRIDVNVVDLAVVMIPQGEEGNHQEIEIQETIEETIDEMIDEMQEIEMIDAMIDVGVEHPKSQDEANRKYKSILR